MMLPGLLMSVTSSCVLVFTASLLGLLMLMASPLSLLMFVTTPSSHQVTQALFLMELATPSGLRQ